MLVRDGCHALTQITTVELLRVYAEGIVVLGLRGVRRCIHVADRLAYGLLETLPFGQVCRILDKHWLLAGLRYRLKAQGFSRKLLSEIFQILVRVPKDALNLIDCHHSFGLLHLLNELFLLPLSLLLLDPLGDDAPLLV